MAFVIPILDRFRDALVLHLSDTRVPDRIIEHYAEILRKASVLYHHDVQMNGGTTAPVVIEPLERMRNWAFDLLVASVSGSGEARQRVARLVMPSAMKRFDTALRNFLDDVKLRGQMPFGR